MHTFIEKKRYILLTVIFIIGLFLRFFLLGTNPPSLNWDEASTGYNAFSILKTGKDEYGNFMPLSIRSFDDYKPPLYTYLDVPFVGIFGLTDFAVRLPSAILGTLTILVIYFLVLELFPKIRKTQEAFSESNFQQEIALLSAFFFAVSPWSLQFSRSAYEGNIGLFFLLSGVLFFLKSEKKHIYLLFSSILFICALYSYHSFRLVVPLLILVMSTLFYPYLLKAKKMAIVAFMILVLFAIPIYSSFVTAGSGTGSRLSMVTIFGASENLDASIRELEYDRSYGDFIGETFHNRRVVHFLAAVKGYLDHYNPDFLYLNGDGGRQHHAVKFGMMYLFDLPLIMVGAVMLTRRITRQKILFFTILVLAPLPSAITTGTPHPVRAIAMLPELLILASVGAVFLISEISRIKYRVLGLKLKYVIFSLLLFVFSVNGLYYLHQYYIHTPIEYGDFWQYGYKEALAIAVKNEKNYDNIVFTYKYDQPYIYYLYYNKIDPNWYHSNWNFTKNGEMPRFERRIGKYIFKNINLGEERKIKNSLLFGTPDEIPENESFKEIKFLNGDTAFRITKT
ncbi:MAG TPA: glycosyltransferase family 39 protein [Candidatus Levybacteria bacterium]|nr:glycosyltransferase family 39 protein [Candidatus Levybacteria bacterium]